MRGSCSCTSSPPFSAMEVPTLPSSTMETSDVFSITDQALSDRLQFIQEIGFGNWGSVWLCRPKLSSSSADGLANPKGQKIAVKLVHRSKTSTTAARVRSLWNEMKIVRTFKNDPHPSIIPFHSFVLTPSYALITMTYLPTLVPVEVEESKAKDWVRFLLSGIDFLHQRGVVHNDIKPANILLSHKNIPVLVDFGFAEKYDKDSPTAFHSNLSYGTPEYLAPERARGLPHDTRKSDVWSLGITFFEILVGRTPFEASDGEQLTTKEDLENYWQRTLQGTWVGTWKMSNGMEKLLQRMIAPNADLRCTASQAMADEFWRPPPESASIHRRSSSYTSSVVFEKDMIRLLESTPTSARSGKENVKLPPGLESPVTFRKDVPLRPLTKSKSQPKVSASKAAPSRKRPYVPPIADLSPIKASPQVSPLASVSGKENSSSAKRGIPSTPRRTFGVLAARNENLPQGAKPLVGGTTKDKTVKALGDVTQTHGGISRRTSQDVKSPNNTSVRSKGKESTSARDRVRDWERERERLREMTRLEEVEREKEEEAEREKGQAKVKKQRKNSIKELEENKENHGNVAFSDTMLPLPAITSPLTQVLNLFPSSMETPTRPTSSQSKRIGHVIRASIDKTFQAYKTSTLGQVTSGRSTPARSLDIDIKDIKAEIDPPRARGTTQTQSWENEVNSTLPVIRNAIQSEKVAADSRKDRLAIWMQNVEKVVEDARQNFAASAKLDTQLPSLPVAPSSRRNSSREYSNRSSRLPRKVLAASQIFADHNNSLMVDISNSVSSSGPTTSDATSSSGLPVTPVDTHSGGMFLSRATAEPAQNKFVIPEIHTPSRRRATVSEDSPVAIRNNTEMSPSKRREKSRSHGNLLQQRIASLTQLEAEINKPIPPEPSPRLSEMFDRSIFIASPPIRSYDDLESPNHSLDDLTSSPCHVEPYPQRRLAAPETLPDTPGQRRLEGVYDRFLMATSGVKRVGKGYQSEFIPPPPSSFSGTSGSGATRRHSKALFGSPKTPMPPPVSSDDLQRRGVSMDELGVITYDSSSDGKEESGGHSTVAFMRKAIKAIKNPKRHSRMIAA